MTNHRDESSERTGELLRSVMRLPLVLDATSDGIYGIDLDGRCSFINRAALSMLGLFHRTLDEVRAAVLVHAG